MAQHINIELTRIKEISLKGIRRTAVFMGLGINTARADEFREYQLSTETLFRIIPDKVDDKQLDDFKAHFEHWIISCGLRELIETFSVFLTAIFKSCLLASMHKKKIKINDPGKRLKSFKWKGVEEQLKMLRAQFGVGTTKEIYFKSINQARNCITHRQGIVGQEDLRNDNSLKMRWWALDLFIETPSGQVISVALPFPKEGIFLKDGGTVCVKVIEKELEFQLGEVIKLNPNDLSEICMVATLATDEILKSTVDYLKSIGVVTKQTEQSD